MNISCDIIMDLIPLVQDEVASEDSVALVEEHTKECEQCNLLLSHKNVEINLDDKKQIKAIQKSLFAFRFLLLIGGALLGIGLTFSSGMFYNSFIMPFIGAIAFFALRKRWWIGAVVLFGFSYLWQTIQGLIEGVFTEVPIGSILVYGFPFSMIYCILFLVGVLVGFLLHFAFGKEKEEGES